MHYWQAGQAPVTHAAEGAASVVATFFLLPALKSVSYQPPPLKRKAAAVTSCLVLVVGKRGNQLTVRLPFFVRLLTRDHKLRTDKHKSAWKFLLRKQSINQY